MATLEVASSDKRHIFPFFRLVPELRNRIYEYALMHDRFEGQLANVALLRVCKEVHQEAFGIFRFQSTLCAKVEAEVYWSYGCRAWRLSVTGDLMPLRLAEASSIIRTTNIWPSAILQVPRIKVTVDHGHEYFANQVLYSLAGMLHEADLNTQDLEVTVTGKPILTESPSELMLAFPISKMPATLNITYHGKDKKYEAAVYDEYLLGNKVKATRPDHLKFHGPRELQNLRPKVDAYLSEASKQGRNAGYTAFKDGQRYIHLILKRIDHYLEVPGAVGRRLDRNLHAHISVLARWVEMRDAGMWPGHAEIVDLKKLCAALQNGQKIREL